MPISKSPFEDYMNGVYDRIKNQQRTFYFEEFIQQATYTSHPKRTETLTKEQRIRQIERELDILRGRIPTPKGYKVDKQRSKGLMKELRELKI